MDQFVLILPAKAEVPPSGQGAAFLIDVKLG